MGSLWDRFQNWRLRRRIRRLADWVGREERGDGLTLEQQITLDKCCRDLEATLPETARAALRGEDSP